MYDIHESVRQVPSIEVSTMYLLMYHVSNCITMHTLYVYIYVCMLYYNRNVSYLLIINVFYSGYRYVQRYIPEDISCEALKPTRIWISVLIP